MKKLFLVDISSFIFRAFYGVRPLSAPDGTPVNAVFGVVSMMNKLMEVHKPDHLVMCRDLPGPGFRNTLYPEYKMNRSEPPEDLIPQFGLIEEYINTYPYSSLAQEGYEADDIIATLVEKYRHDPELEIYIVSSDKDLMQLMGERVYLFDAMKDKILQDADVLDKFGVKPDKVIDVQSLCGDAIDNIPGVAGIGPKTASKLINQYGSLKDLLANKDSVAGKVGEAIRQSIGLIEISQQLVTLAKDVPIKADWNALAVHDKNINGLTQFYKKLNFKKFLQDHIANEKSAPPVLETLSLFDEPRTETNESHVSSFARDQGSLSLPQFITLKSEQELSDVVHKIRAMPDDTVIAFDTETTSLNHDNGILVGISFCADALTSYYLPLNHKSGENVVFTENVKDLCQYLFMDDKKKYVAQNAKFDKHFLNRKGIRTPYLADDTLMASFIINPEGQHNLDALAMKYLGYQTLTYTEIVPPKGDFSDVAIDVATRYSAEDAWVTWSLQKKLRHALKEQNLLTVYDTIEIPLVSVLERLEDAGVLLDREFLSELEKEFTSRISLLVKEIYEIAGEEFNINSPKQLATILFEKLQLPVVRKTKTGYSTDADVLQVLSRQHALPAKLLEYRTLAKLNSTYVSQLGTLINPVTGRVHTHFNQAIVATGRLSSTDPNLQNIPIRTEDGKRIRRAFIAPQGCKLVSFDYSQIELRLLAVLTQDPSLMQAYREQMDIHAVTASRIFSVSLETVTDNQRAVGKTVNFGVIYGQSPFGLSEQLGVSQTEAKQFIESFFNSFATVRQYREQVLDKARREGYVETLLGRRRFVPELNSQNRMVVQNAERVAFNAIFQGTAADLIKIAMIKIDDMILKGYLDAKMILQVHDELVFEIPENKLEMTCDRIRNIMEHALVLDVPIEVSVGIGRHWAET